MGKQTKYLLNGLELLQTVFKVKCQTLRRQADALGVTLGDDHDLAVLAGAARRQQAGKKLLEFEKEIGKRRRHYQRQALRIGERLYRHSPRDVARKIELKIAKRS